MKQKTFLFSGMFLLFLLFSLQEVSSIQLNVPDNYASLQEAMDAAQSGDLIRVSDTNLSPREIRQVPSGTPGLTIVSEVAMSAASPGGPCEIIDFEYFSAGTPITNEIPGVSFEVVNQTCTNMYMRVADSFYSDTFADKVLLIDQGCPDFSPEYVKMVFDYPQNNVSFNLGFWDGDIEVRVYDTISGGTPVIIDTVTIPGTGFAGVSHRVEIERTAGDIKRIEIEADSTYWEAIDDLLFRDTTPPEILIASPSDQQCVCGEIMITGTSCDPQGSYDRDRLEYRRIYPNPSPDWVLIREYVNSPVCTTGSLYAWDTTGTGIIDGLYLLRVTALNDCGLSTSEQLTVYVDNEFSTITLDAPLGVVGGNICFDGTVWDLFCFSNYTVEYRPESLLSWAPVDAANPAYSQSISNNPFAQWTAAAGLSDGDYIIRVTGETQCGSTDAITQSITLDNTPPTAEIQYPLNCTDPDGIIKFVGTAYDENLYQWTLEVWDAAAGQWTLINKAFTNVVNDTLGSWTRPANPACPDIFRLRVWDQANVNPCSTWGHDRHQSEHYIVLKAKGTAICKGDYDGDGDIDGADLELFANDFGGTCPSP